MSARPDVRFSHAIRMPQSMAAKHHFDLSQGAPLSAAYLEFAGNRRKKMLEWAKRILVSRSIPGVADEGPCELSCPDVETCELAPWEQCERRIARTRQSSQSSSDAESVLLSKPRDQNS